MLITATRSEFDEYNWIIDSKSSYPIATGIFTSSGDQFAFVNSGYMGTQNNIFYGPEGQPFLNNALSPLLSATFGTVCGSFSPALSSGFVIGDNGEFHVQPSDSGHELLLYPNIGSSQLAPMQGTFHLRFFHLHAEATAVNETFGFAPGLTSWPNPTNGSSIVAFSLAAPVDADLSVYDASGALVRRLANQHFPTGLQGLTWDGRGTNGEPVAAGVYFNRLTTMNRRITSKVVITR